jgi:hypothetical protein
MLGKYRVASQLVASAVVLNSTVSLVSYDKHDKEIIAKINATIKTITVKSISATETIIMLNF